MSFYILKHKQFDTEKFLIHANGETVMKTIMNFQNIQGT